MSPRVINRYIMELILYYRSPVAFVFWSIYPMMNRLAKTFAHPDAMRLYLVEINCESVSADMSIF